MTRKKTLKDTLNIDTPKKQEEKQKDDLHVVLPTYEDYLETLNGKFIDWNGKSSDRKGKCLHPSSFSGCPRRLQYEWLGVPSTRRIDAKLQRTFSVGHYLHKMIQEDLKRSGVLLLDEVPVRHEKLKIFGHTDGLLKFDNRYHALLEIKTINPRDFKTLVVPSDDYLIQANCYLFCVERTRKILRNQVRKGKKEYDSLTKFEKAVHDIDHELDQINFFYWDKGSSDIKEFVVKRDDDIIEAIEDKAVEILNAMEEEVLLPRIAESPTQSPCAGCDFRNWCWDQFNSEKVNWANK